MYGHTIMQYTHTWSYDHAVYFRPMAQCPVLIMVAAPSLAQTLTLIIPHCAILSYRGKSGQFACTCVPTTALDRLISLPYVLHPMAMGHSWRHCHNDSPKCTCAALLACRMPHRICTPRQMPRRICTLRPVHMPIAHSWHKIWQNAAAFDSITMNSR